MKFFLIIALLSIIAFGQKQYIVDNGTATINWEHNVSGSDSIKYLVYTKTELFDPWLFVGETTEKRFTVDKNGYNLVAFGVRAIIGKDTSSIHSSLDGDACLDSKSDSCYQYGSWYINWKVVKPTKLNLDQ